MLSPNEAWKPLPKQEWNRTKARHLASRLGYSLTPEFVDHVEELGPEKTLQYYLGHYREFAPSPSLIGMREAYADYREEIRSTEDQEARQRMRMARNRESLETQVQAGIDWYRFARQIENAPQEKLASFFQNVWVVAYRKVRQPNLLFDFKTQIRLHLGRTYPEMCKELGLSGAMVRYLDLQRNTKVKPNENFARELFELFILGEGNYTETDIKEAARALTGYQLDREGELRFHVSRFDKKEKTIFGQTGRYDFYDVVDLAFEQPAAASFLPQELCRFYLSDDGLPTEYTDALGKLWRNEKFSITALIWRFFSSKLFYEQTYRGNMIKSPEHFYLGLLQDLDLDVTPIPRFSYALLRQMGQTYFDPPNVRGWVGGQKWINSATLSARTRLVQGLFEPLPRRRLNADEIRALEAAETLGASDFVFSEKSFDKAFHLDMKSPEVLSSRFYANGSTKLLAKLMENIPEGPDQGKAALLATLSAPEYHLC